MKRTLTRNLDRLDDWLAAASLRRAREHPALLAFFFHGLFENTAEIAADVVWPSQPLLVAELRKFIEYFLEHGYRFVSPAQILSGLDPGGFHVLLTFDDGYANNQRALPILRALSVPATFFVSARHVTEGKAFWWNAVYRERRRRGATLATIRREIESLKRQAPGVIEEYVHKSFGDSALQPLGDTDRPFTAEELRAFGADPLVTLGNHTMDHIDLTRHSEQRRRDEVRGCQEYLANPTGALPPIIAYPYGHYDGAAIASARAEGLQLAVTGAGYKNRLPLQGVAAMTIARTFIPCGREMLPACQRSRSDVRLRPWLSALRKRRRGVTIAGG